MNELRLPEAFGGPWHNLLILSYGADLAFFEHTLLRQMKASCRNRIVLADGRTFLESCKHYAKADFVRHLNRRYVAEGIWGTPTAHGKLILLTSPEAGKLFIGSGNLSWQGYASGGELFTAFQYREEDSGDLSAFLDVYQLVNRLVEQDYVRGHVVRHLQRLWETTPWLYGTSRHPQRLIRHNLDTCFLDQLREEVRGGKVEELWVMAPFHDEHLRALQSLIGAFQPQEVTVLAQPRRCSVDPLRLQKLVSDSKGRCRIMTATKENNPYLHAKVFLLKLQDKAICLQGSPNCSQAALLLRPPVGNMEIASLMTGSRDEFDYLFDSLVLEPVLSAELLDVSFESEDTTVPYDAGTFMLTGGEWEADRMVLRYQGMSPPVDDLQARIGSFRATVEHVDDLRKELHFGLSEAMRAMLAHTTPVSFCWQEQGSFVESNPIYICDLTALAAELEETSDPGVLNDIGHLDLDDQELEQLLGELEASLPIDRQSIWRLVGKRDIGGTDESGEDEAPHLSYDEIDYDLIRQHPKIQQYYAVRGGASQYGKTRLQIILSAITDHFHELLSSPISSLGVSDVLSLIEGESLPEDEEIDDTSDAAPERHWSSVKRVRSILKRFIRRYLRGLRHPDFHELVGYAVVTQNYIIFTFVLWRLLIKKWVEAEFVIDAFLKTATFFWGSERNAGYFAALEPEQQDQVREWIRAYHCDTALLVSIHQAAQSADQDGTLYPLRDFWRAFLERTPVLISPEVVEEAWYIIGKLDPYHPPKPTEIVSVLTELAWWNRDGDILNSLEAKFGCQPTSCKFTSVKIHGRSDPVKCLQINAPGVLDSLDRACSVIQAWRSVELLEYYRATQIGTGALIIYETEDRSCVYKGPDGEIKERTGVALEANIWETPLAKLNHVALDLEDQIKKGYDHARGVTTGDQLAPILASRSD